AATAVARRLRIPTVVFSWESLAREYPLFARRRRSLALRYASGVLGGNTLAAGLLRSVAPAARHAAIPQFGVVVPSLPEPRDDAGLVIGFIGRLVPERGVDLLLQACNHVLGAWTLAILGTGPEQEALEALAQRYGQASRVRWIGGLGREAIDRFWTEIDVLVVPSRATPDWVERSHPLLLEAMARAIPVVTTDTGALPELVGDAGIVVNDAEPMGLALQHLLAEPGERRRLGLRGRQRVLSHFSDSAIAERTLEFWQSVVTSSDRATLSSTGAVA
ncbi:MAG: glycosyltransferase family 4 protein, partial [Gemmatimonadales bacterium]